MSYALQFQSTGLLDASGLASGATTATLTTSAFGSPSGTQLYVIDYGVPGTAEIVSATVSGTAMTSITRGLSGGAAGTTAHAGGATVGAFFVPQHYDRVANRTLGYAETTANFTTTATPAITDVTSMSVTVTVPVNGARIRITVLPGYVKTTAAAGTTVGLYIREGSTSLGTTLTDVPVSNYAVPVICQYVTVATAGSHTYKASISQSAAGTVTFGTAGATGPAFILVENIE